MRAYTYILASLLLIWQPALSQAEMFNKQSAFEKVLKNNPNYQAILAEVEIISAEQLQASFKPNPNAVLEVENFAGNNDLESFDGAEAELTVGLEQIIETGGKRARRTEVLELSRMAASENAILLALNLLSKTENTLVRIAIAQERVDVASNRLRLNTKMHDIINQRVSVAKASDIQHTQMDIEQASAEIEKLMAEKELLSAQSELAQLLGVENASTFEIDVDLSALPKKIEKEKLLKALRYSSSLQKQELLRLQAKSMIALEKTNALPDTTFGLGVRRFNENDDTALLASLSVPIPVFDRNQGNIKKARAKLISATAEKQAVKVALKHRSIQLWEEFSLARIQARRYQNEIIPKAKTAYQQADEGYRQGAFPFLSLLDAQRTLYDVQASHLNALKQLYQAKAQIDFLMGSYRELVKQNIKIKNKG